MANNGESQTAEQQRQDLHRWLRQIGEGAPEPALGTSGRDGWLAPSFPFSFTFGGQSSADLLPRWHREMSTAVAAKGETTFHVELTDPSSGVILSWDATIGVKVPTVEWILHFENRGTSPAPILENLRALDLVLATDSHELVAYHATGGIAAPDAFAPQETSLPRTGSSRAPGATGPGGLTEFRLAPTGGRSSNGVLPYFNVEANWNGYRGVVVGIGWSGQWEAKVSRFASAPPSPVQPDLRGPNGGVSQFRSLDRLRIEAGMEGLHLSIEPGESIRSPRILLVPWEGDRFRGQNDLRCYVYAHAPRLDGKPPEPALFCNVGIVDPNGGALGAGFTFEELADKASALGLDFYVVDAGWFAIPDEARPGAEARWIDGVGNYTVRKDLFPEGLDSLSDTVRRQGMRFGVWFEPERAAPRTQVYREHQDWFLSTPLGHGFVFNLGNPAARQWLTDTLSRFVEKLDLGWFRYDANANYLPAWRANDSADRQGITEIRYVEGLYQLWSDLLARHPNLHLDGCASGGRRMDFEALRHHHGQTHTDWLWGDPCGMQSILHGGNQWLPGLYFNSWLGAPAAPVADTAEQKYGFFSGIGGGLNVGWRMFNHREDVDLALGRRWVDEFRSLRHIFDGDFYPLSPHTTSEGRWLASQYHRADLGEGLVVAFRRRDCPVASVYLHPCALDPEAVYEVRSQRSGERTIRRGQELLAGLEIRLDEAPAHELIHYRRR